MHVRHFYSLGSNRHEEFSVFSSDLIEEWRVMLAWIKTESIRQIASNYCVGCRHEVFLCIRREHREIMMNKCLTRKQCMLFDQNFVRTFSCEIARVLYLVKCKQLEAKYHLLRRQIPVVFQTQVHQEPDEGFAREEYALNFGVGHSYPWSVRSNIHFPVEFIGFDHRIGSGLSGGDSSFHVAGLVASSVVGDHPQTDSRDRKNASKKVESKGVVSNSSSGDMASDTPSVALSARSLWV